MGDEMDVGSPLAKVEDSLDADIERAKEELKTACARRDALVSALLSSERVRNLSDDTVPSPFVERQPLAEVLSRHQGRTQVQDRRSLLATTLFSVKDPDPHGGEFSTPVYGVRIERYSKLQSKFLTPGYVFLRKTPRHDGVEGEAWKVHRHTLPPCIPIRALARKYLPDTSNIQDGQSKQAPQKHDVQEFVNSLTNEVVGLLRRQEAIEAIQSSDIKSAVAVNAEATDVRISWKNGAVTRMRVSSTGTIENVVAEKGHARDGELERKILAAEKLDLLQGIS